MTKSYFLTPPPPRLVAPRSVWGHLDPHPEPKAAIQGAWRVFKAFSGEAKGA